MANVWNIGAEGQLTMGAIVGSIAPVMFPDWQDPSILVVMLIMGSIGGALYGAIPGLLKTRFNANEILTSLMLVYVAGLFLDWLVRGPWRDPQGYQFSGDENFRGLATASNLWRNHPSRRAVRAARLCCPCLCHGKDAYRV